MRHTVCTISIISKQTANSLAGNLPNRNKKAEADRISLLWDNRVNASHIDIVSTLLGFAVGSTMDADLPLRQ